MTPTNLSIPWYVQAVLDWLGGQPVFSGLLALQVLDIASGICLSVVKQTLCSSCSLAGMSKKALVILVVTAGAVAQSFVPNIPIANILATYYTVTEIISILENAAAAGLPLPRGLIESLRKMREQKEIRREQKSVRSVTNVTVITPPGHEPLGRKEKQDGVD